tara:strand:- start:1024 stop:1674 length:651 start_codon:yes stop_codon:yes gene_type:complete
MAEIKKRFFTSILLILILLLAIYSQIVLTFFLALCFYQMISEFYFILSKTFKQKKLNIYLSMLFILITLSCIIIFVWTAIVGDSNDKKLVFFLILCITISTDIGGFIFGKIFKGKKLSKISPKKTYSGMIGSYIFSLVAAYSLFKNYLNLTDLIFFTLIISTSSQIGDLLISYLKRNINIKDTSNILPGHGGLLDRFDGLILAIPIGLILFKFYDF